MIDKMSSLIFCTAQRTKCSLRYKPMFIAVRVLTIKVEHHVVDYSI